MTPRHLSDAERRALSLILDAIIPPSGDGRLPGAGEAGVAEYLERAWHAMPDLRATVVEGLAELETAARHRHGRGFAELEHGDRAALVGEQGFVFPLTLHAYAGYYQLPRVVEALGLEARPPHPAGYAMEANDLSLLDPVRQRPKMFRQC